MHLRIWCIGRLETSVLRPLSTVYRSAPLIAYVLRRLGAKVGDNLQCAHGVEFSGPLDLLSIEDDVAIQTGAYLHLSRWSGQELHIGPIKLESGCKIGMRAAISGDVTVGRGSWITPFTPILDDVGPAQMWEGSPARFSGHYTGLKRTTSRCQYAYPPWLLELCNILMQVFLDFWLIVAPTAMVTWFAVIFIPGSETALAGDYFQLPAGCLNAGE
jgi:acetyltransferase-like isoleucine patch superfamily enzyme